MFDPGALLLRSDRFVKLAPLLLLPLLLGAAERMGVPSPAVMTELPLRAEENPYSPDPMKKAAAWPVAAPPEGEKPTDGTDEVVVGRRGAGPWRLFESTFPEEGCHAPRLSGDGSVALALCGGMDVSRPEDQHIVLLKDRKVVRYRTAVAPLDGGVSVDLNPDGTRFAVVVEEGGGGRSVHLVDLERGTDTRISGGWSDPGNAVVAADARAVAFSARIGRDFGVVLVHLDEARALVVERSPTPMRVYGTDERGERVLYTVGVNKLNYLRVAHAARGTITQVSNVRADVTGAWMDRDIDSVFLSERIGGLCALAWGNATARKRIELFSTMDGCLSVEGMDDSGSLVLYAELERGAPRRHKLYDRKAKQERYEVIEGCDEPYLSRDGRLMAVRCPEARAGGGVWMFKLPEADARR